MGEKCREWLLAAGASGDGSPTPSAPAIQTHAYGGARMGDDPDENVADAWCFSHEVPNLDPRRVDLPHLAGATRPRR